MYIHPQPPLKVKTAIFRLYNRKTKANTHLFSVFECIEPDMQIRDDHSVFESSKLADSISGEKVFYTECVCNIDAAFLANPLKAFIIPSQTGPDTFRFINKHFADVPESKESYLLSSIREVSGLSGLFPDEDTPTWVRTWVDDKRETYSFLQQDNKLMKQLQDLSVKNIGIDITRYPEYIGAIFLVWHHALIRTIDVSGIAKPQRGIVLEICFRTQARPKLTVNICQVEQGDCVVDDQTIELRTPGYRQFIKMPVIPNMFLLKVYDANKNLIIHKVCQGLNQTIGVNISTPSRVIEGVSYEMPDGTIEQLPPVQKWSSEKSTIGKQVISMGDYFSNAEKVRAVEKAKTLGDFIFFDGQKDKKEQNRENARNYVQALLNKASKRCMVCDDFFDAPDFGNFLYHVKNESVDLRVMSSMGDMGAGCALRLQHVVDDYNKAMGRKCAFARMLKGKHSIVHDRFIVCDDEIWAVGASFNELGARASVIYKIPHEAGLKIIGKLEEWWCDELLSEDVHDVEQPKKKKKTLKQLFKNIWHEIKEYITQ